ncbi:uncharacterized protein LOC116261366 [Nymphaea colorata]|uniref:uncharacterized protein LOC116261366 n=1 Tax=Nymphaea colorata TaxID=210225 RepID=UPI00129D3434|nr:uncharacterized protein LOC116261366 [Nymphaea colorata]
MRFHYILAGWEGSATDARVLYSALEDNLHPLEISHGKYYLADAGYPNIVGLLTLYRRCRYHLSEFNVSGSRQIETEEELYNYRHSSLRTTVERAFGLLKARFPILKNHVSYPISTQVKIVQATCVLHNFIINHNPNAEQFPSDDINDSEVSEIINDDENTEQTQIRGSNNELREQITSTMWNDYVSSKILIV